MNPTMPARNNLISASRVPCTIIKMPSTRTCPTMPLGLAPGGIAGASAKALGPTGGGD